MRLRFILALLLVMGSLTPCVLAATVCVPVNSSGWTADQKSKREPVVRRLAFEAGQTVTPTITDTQVCVPDPTFDPVVVLAPLLSRINQSIQTDADEVMVQQQVQQAFTNEITTNTFCTAELAELDTRIDAAVDAAPNTVSGLKTMLKAALKKMVRCTRARAGP